MSLAYQYLLSGVLCMNAYVSKVRYVPVRNLYQGSIQPEGG